MSILATKGGWMISGKCKEGTNVFIPWDAPDDGIKVNNRTNKVFENTQEAEEWIKKKQ